MSSGPNKVRQQKQNAETPLAQVIFHVVTEYQEKVHVSEKVHPAGMKEKAGQEREASLAGPGIRYQTPGVDHFGRGTHAHPHQENQNAKRCDSPGIAIFRLRNRLEEQLVIGAQRGILGSLTIIIDRSPIQGSVHQDVTRSPIRTFQGVERLVLPGKGEKEIRIPIPLEESLSTSGLVLRVRIEGRFRPSRWEVEGKSVNLALPIPLAECWIVPVAQRRLALSPLRKFEVALILRDIDTFFTAGQLAVWAAEEDEELKERLVKLLVGSLPQLDDYGFAIARRFLRQLSGLSGPELAKADRAFWKEWYEKERERSKAKGDAEKTPDETPAPRVGNEAPDR